MLFSIFLSGLDDDVENDLTFLIPFFLINGLN